MSLGIGLLGELESIHRAGLTYNDLKPQNILLGKNFEHNIFKDIEIHLIDFGFTEPYLENGIHVPSRDLDNFRGNIPFSSLN